MKAVIQRVSSASVSIDGKTTASIERGLLILLGVAGTDTAEDISWMVKKIAALRIFGDQEGMMNLDVNEAGGAALVVSQFTLHASYKKGNRPSFIAAARPETAIPHYEAFIGQLSALLTLPVCTGIFGADMQVSLINDGPVTILIDTQNKE